ncbi:hypothetical protein PQ472_01900 [Lacticaseibacillus pabuli]|uniref:Uncharacterized protein n=1 Tax=Lacticaseibacillus pabuli TaxID=3025672 RepID=A0ABY7WS72_9LACO|nr:hypothetical protein [Lacticaseibacillus sp. KACC 23028]WDF83022.1 hypothetical protein PQ472_01900 [Lacticaseibacillus sp. KACC 23028]
MLNFNDQEILSIINDALEPADARHRVTIKAEKDEHALSSDPLWASNDFVRVNNLLAYTELFADKLKQSFDTVDGLKGTDFNSRLWMQSVAPSAEHTTIVFFLATEDENRELFTVVDPLSTDGYIVASNLPTLPQITGDEDDLGYNEDELRGLSVLIREMYAAGYNFRTVDETVLQPVDGLTFTTKFDTSNAVSESEMVMEPGNLSISVELRGTVSSYHVLDEDGHDWMDLGTASMDGDTFTWASTSIPGELVGQNLTLQANVRSAANVPAMDELFVIASSNAILMKQLPGDGNYALTLPKHRDLSVSVDVDKNTVSLSYPDSETQIIELNTEYPFFGQWLQAVLPKKPAFN